MPQPIAPPAVLTLLEGATRAVSDSLGMVQFMAEVADRTGATFHVADLRQAATAGELVDLVVARTGGG